MRIETLVANEYISTRVFQNYTQTQGFTNSLTIHLRTLFQEQIISGFLVRMIVNEEEALEEDLDLASIKTINGGIFPFIWLNVTHTMEVADKIQLERIKHEYDLVEV